MEELYQDSDWIVEGFATGFVLRKDWALPVASVLVLGRETH